VISRQGCPVSSDPADTPACLTHRTQFHVTLYTRARARASRKVTTTCVRCVRRGAKARGPISATQPANRLQTRTSIEFSSLAVFARTGCKPANPVRTKVRTLLFPNNPAHVSVDAAFSPLTRTAKCEPQTLQTLFPGQTVAQCCARAPRIGISSGRTPFTWGTCACADHNNRR
jgi:hypothetical protein